MAQIITHITEALAPTPPEIKLYPSYTQVQHAPEQRWFMLVSYVGKDFCGWQRQPNAPSVQQTLEEAMSVVLRHQVTVTGAGRTDTGVNARCMWVHFDTLEAELSPDRFVKSLNQLLPTSIAVHDLCKVRRDAHARFDAQTRTYKYFAVRDKDPFLSSLSWRYGRPLDFASMNEAASILLQTDDFTSFAKLHSDAKTNICRVTRARWEPLSSAREARWPAEGAVFTITADRFLRNMVRAVVGTLVEVGHGKLTVDQFAEVIRAKDRCKAGQSMPAQALFLWDMTYPEDIFLR